MSDLISRQAAIDALIKWYGCEPTDIGAFENIIEQLPYAQSERKMGRWINKRYRWLDCISMWWINSYECSACGAAGLHDWKFCPNCGADMRGEQDERLQ